MIMEEENKPKHGSLNMIKKDIVQKRAQQFEKQRSVTEDPETSVDTQSTLERGKPPRKSPARPMTNPPPPPASLTTSPLHHSTPDGQAHSPGGSGQTPGHADIAVSPHKPSAQPGANPATSDVQTIKEAPVKPKLPTGPKPRLEQKPAPATRQPPEIKDKHQQPVSAGVATAQSPPPPRTTTTLIADKAKLFQGASPETVAISDGASVMDAAGYSTVDSRMYDSQADRLNTPQKHTASTKPTVKLKPVITETNSGYAAFHQEKANKKTPVFNDCDSTSPVKRPAEVRPKMKPPPAPGHHPTYAKINKVNRKDRRRSRSRSHSPESPKTAKFKSPEPLDVSPPQISQTYDGVVVLPGKDSTTKMNNSQPASPGQVGPPKKPPRTFEHDTYLKQKIQRKEEKAKARLKKLSEKEQCESSNDHTYEDIQPPGIDQNKPIANKFNFNNIGATYEELAVVCPVSDPDELKKLKTTIRGRTALRKTSGGQSPLYDIVAEEEKLKETEKSEKELTRIRVPRNPSSRLPAPPRPPPPSSPHSPNSPRSPRVSGEWDKTADRSKDNVIHVNRHNPCLSKDAFVKKKEVSNPGYNKSQHEVLPIESFEPLQGAAGLRRFKSDECLYSDVDAERRVVQLESDYQDPVDVIGTRGYVTEKDKNGVVVDSEGYAQPYLERSNTMLSRSKKSSNGNSIRKFNTFTRSQAKRGRLWHTTAGVSHKQRSAGVQEKLSSAYSILRCGNHTSATPGKDGNVLACISDEDDGSDSDVDMDEHKKKLNYLLTLRQQHPDVMRRKKMVHTEKQGLFEFAAVVGLEVVDGMNKYRPTVLYRFPPEHNDKEVNTVALFCFPDVSNIRPVTQCNTETFSFTLTDTCGVRKYGYCRKILPPGYGNRLPEVYCVVSSLLCWEFYDKLLEEIARKRFASMETARELIQLAYSKPIPAPGCEAWIAMVDPRTNQRETLYIRRQLDTRLPGVRFDKLFTCLSVGIMLKVFASILLERRIIFRAQHLSTLSSCIHSIVSLLYPFSWQHVYVPILPKDMIQICDSPTPYIVGIVNTFSLEHCDLHLEEVLIVDLDNNRLLQSQGDEGKIIPKKLQRALTTALKDELETSTSIDEELVAEAFLRLFVETVGHYTEYIDLEQQNGERVFMKKPFQVAVVSKTIRLFLEWFTETQMFDIFIQEQIDRSHEDASLFDMRIMEYRQEMEEGPTKNVRDVGRKIMQKCRDVVGKIKEEIRGSKVFV